MGVRAWVAAAIGLVLAPLAVGPSASVARGAGDTAPLARAAAPAWADWLPLPEPARRRLPEVEDGIYTLLTDTQVRFDGEHYQTFRRTAQLVTERTGLEDTAQQQIEVDPATEELVIHRIAIWRHGRMTDVTRATSIELLRRETSLDKGIIDGARTALIRIGDVRVGDTVDLAWSWRDRNPLWRGVYNADFSLGWSSPVAMTRVRLATPAATRLFVEARHGAPPARATTQGGVTTREWRAIDPDPVRDEERSPAWWRPWARVSVSTVPDWATVVRWGSPLYMVDATLPPAYARQIDAIAAATADPAARTVAALRLVQDSIRYTSVSIGEGGFRPRPPARTVANGFGDCKDKAALLVATLARLGVRAWPALTDIDEGPALAQVLPTPGAFDHVIVLARVAGRDRWLDATMSHQGGDLAGLAALPYGFALPIRPGQDRLLAIANPVPALPTMATLDRYRRTDDGVAFSTTTLFSYDEADIKRAAIADSGMAKLTRDELAFYRKLYPGVALRSPIQVRDDRAGNRLLVHERFLLPASAPGYAQTLRSFEVQAATLRDLFKTAPAERGAAPITVPYTINRTHRVVLDTPGYRPAAPDAMRSDGDAFRLAMDSRREGDRLTLAWSLVGKAPTVPGDAAAAYADQVKALDDAIWWSLDLTSATGGAPGDARAAALAVAMVLLALGWLVIAGFALAKLLRERHGPAAPFVAMPPWRFVLLTAATFGLYPSYWAWRHWRWTKAVEGEAISPFFRALFLTLWAGPTFFSANRRVAKPLPDWLGYAAAVGIVVTTVALRVADVIVGSAYLALGAMPLGLFHLPALIAVNRANFRARVRRGARLGPLAIAGLVAGAVSWTVLLIAATR